MRWIVFFVVVVVAAAAYFGARHYYAKRPASDRGPGVESDQNGEFPSALSARGAAKGQNLVLITLDTTRADRLGCYGYAHSTTPNIDALAQRALRFDHAITPAPITLPSHSSMMTGLDVPTHGVRNNGGFRLDDRHTTLAESLRAAGYRTAAFIAAFVLDGRYGLTQGFDHYDDRVNPSGEHPEGNSFNERPAAAVIDAAIAWIGPQLEAKTRTPFFAWLHLFDAHNPYSPPEPFLSAHAGRPYDGEIAYADAQLGRLFDYFRGRGVYDDTLIVITADHGEGLGDHGEFFHAHFVYDSTVRVPLLISCPRVIAGKHTVSSRVFGHIDLFPTLAHLLDADCPAAIDGQNFFVDRPVAGRTLHVETMATLLDHGWAPLHGLRRVGAKFIQGVEKEYYDLQTDPREEKNLYSSERAASRELEGDLAGRISSWAGGEEIALAAGRRDPAEAERLAALGYGRFVSEGSDWGRRDPVKMLPIYHKALRAEQWSLEGEPHLAVQEIREVLALDGENPGNLYLAKLIYQRAKLLEEAEICLRKAIRLAPRSDGYVQLAKLFLEQGNIESEEFNPALEEAARLDPMDGGIHTVRGDRLAMRALNPFPGGTSVAEKKRLLEEAIAEFEKAIAVDPERRRSQAEVKIRQARGFLAKLGD